MKLEFPGPPVSRMGGDDEARTRRAMLHMLEDLQRDREVIRRAREKWVDTVDAIAIPLMVHDTEFRIVRANKAYAALAGADFPEIIGKVYWTCFPRIGGPLPGCRSAIEAGHATGRSRAHVEEFALASGETFVSRVFEVHNPETNRLDSLHIFENVTEQRRAEERSRMAKVVIENAPVVLIRCSAAAKWPIAYASDNICAWGYEAGALVSGGVEFSGLVHPDDLPALRDLVDQNARERNDRFSAEFRIVTGDGGARWIDGRWFVERDPQGDPAYYQGVMTDITSRKDSEAALGESEQKLNVIFDAVSDGIAVADVETQRLVMCNSAMARMLGAAPDEVTRLSVSDLLPPDRPDLLEDFERHARGVRSFSADVLLRRRDGTLFHADIGGGLLAIGGKPHAVGIFRDVTERRRSEQALAGRLAELQRWQELNLDREERVIELKREVNELLGRLGEPARYSSAQ